jgi:diguanylate cyclase (GGDEF)-like protein
MGIPAPARHGPRGASSRVHTRRSHLVRFPIGWKFLVVLATVVPSMLAISWVAAESLSNVKQELDDVYEDNLASTRVVGEVAEGMREAEVVVQRLVTERHADVRDGLLLDLRDRVVPRVEALLFDLRSLSQDDAEDLELEAELERTWRAFVAYATSPEFLTLESPRDRDLASEHVGHLGESVTAATEPIHIAEERQARDSKAQAERSYSRSVVLFRTIAIVSLLAAISATLWLTRSVVRRVREYSAFAGTVASGAMHERVRPRGRDELTDLGWALNEMITRGEAAQSYDDSQDEFVEALQVTQNEEEAHELLKRHIERSVPQSVAVVLNRNNSADRLEATTELPDDRDFAERIAEAKPRDCVAVRLARSHMERPDADPLIACSLCHPLDGSTTCRPLLVGGEVIGSVLVNRSEELDEHDATRVRDSVGQAAPVLANLRNLALAQLRAATDSLTGLPNTRAVQDTLNRVVAQAARMVWPLSAVLLDLDHFKRINDELGHGRGDEVLAAVGVALQSTARDSDFVGRYGGEEFIVLLPNTDREGAVVIAERVRQTIADIDVLGERRITASFGIAVFPEDAPDPTRLIRNADRALYRAKANGRNRVEVFSMEDSLDPHRRASDALASAIERAGAEAAQGAIDD